MHSVAVKSDIFCWLYGWTGGWLSAGPIVTGEGRRIARERAYCSDRTVKLRNKAKLPGDWHRFSYQTALDHDPYKALKALREAQSWRQAKAVLAASAVPAVGRG